MLFQFIVLLALFYAKAEHVFLDGVWTEVEVRNGTLFYWKDRFFKPSSWEPANKQMIRAYNNRRVTPYGYPYRYPHDYSYGIAPKTDPKPDVHPPNPKFSESTLVFSRNKDKS